MNFNVLDSIDMHELGKELQQARIKRGLTEEDASKITEVDHTTIIAIEKGERRISTEELIKLAQAYGCEVSDFVRQRPSPKNVKFASEYDRLEELSAIYREKLHEAQQQIDSMPVQDEKLPMYYKYLAVDAYDRGLITEGQFARFLNVSRVEARYIAEIVRERLSGVIDDVVIYFDIPELPDVQNN